MSYLPQDLRTGIESRIDAQQQERILEWRRLEAWRLALARARREQELRLQRAYTETVRGA